MPPSPLRVVPSAWRFALVGALASLPVTVVLNRLPNSEADVTGGIMVVGAFVAGVAAASRSTDADAAGVRAGLLAGAVAVLTPVATAGGSAVGGTAIPFPPSRVAIFAAMSAVALALSSIFGLVFGRIGGWVVTALATRRTADPS
ncbi:DUF5518 domain-containing protein [Halopelagius longus]|uniref:DUF5518 domain-containing protein n=1 Tax=Halopelagius longus TaxID=1236180 RepID=A0A1H1A951_9EURY|nr:DUF5518 domain-containing protein [Halopelagius longus]RDI70286.1 hypothetical protein DWB78_00305 [Halopelagius longus]SDQ36164.1 hypothetical protein SAMN05216278_1224 [Halopelagius longus]